MFPFWSILLIQLNLFLTDSAFETGELGLAYLSMTRFLDISEALWDKLDGSEPYLSGRGVCLSATCLLILSKLLLPWLFSSLASPSPIAGSANS